MLVAVAWDRINNDRMSRYFMMLFDGGVCLQDLFRLLGLSLR